jgi:hypothetical protein
LMTASIRKSCRVFSMMLISDTKKPSSVSEGSSDTLVNAGE